jgi:hypothetical protein
MAADANTRQCLASATSLPELLALTVQRRTRTLRSLRVPREPGQSFAAQTTADRRRDRPRLPWRQRKDRAILHRLRGTRRGPAPSSSRLPTFGLPRHGLPHGCHLQHYFAGYQVRHAFGLLSGLRCLEPIKLRPLDAASSFIALPNAYSGNTAPGKKCFKQRSIADRSRKGRKGVPPNSGAPERWARHT